MREHRANAKRLDDGKARQVNRGQRGIGIQPRVDGAFTRELAS